MADKEATERKVYVLPSELVERIKAYQASNGIASEVEAARRLLDMALQMRDGVEDILLKLQARFAEDKDLRVLAGTVLTSHVLVTEVQIGENSLTFKMRSGWTGKIRNDGTLWFGSPDDSEDYMRSFDPNSSQRAQRVSSRSGDLYRPMKNDLDDEIPF